MEYCKFCGKEIESYGKFCPNCGKQQSESANNKDYIKDSITNFKRKLEDVLGQGKARVVVGIYLLWAILHLMFLLTIPSYRYDYDGFWPFKGSWSGGYDKELFYHFYPEYFVYVILPVLLFLIYVYCFRKNKHK